MNVVRGGSCRRRDKYAAHHSRSSAFVVRIWWLSYGAWNRLLRWWRYQPDHPHRDHPAAAQSHLRPFLTKAGECSSLRLHKEQSPGHDPMRMKKVPVEVQSETKALHNCRFLG